jgi:nitroreductase
MTLSAAEVNHLKKAATVDGVLPAIQERWSPRAFSDRDVSAGDLARVFEAARWAPSSNNGQPWSYLVGVRGSSTHRHIASTLAGFNQAWAPKVPVLILGIAKTAFAHNGALNAYALYDLGAATALLTVEATHLGLATHQMGGFDREAARKALDIPEDHALGAVIALGYQGDPATLQNDQLIAREIAPRERKPLKDFVFSEWGVSADLG